MPAGCDDGVHGEAGELSHPKVSNKLLATRSRELPPTILATASIVEQFRTKFEKNVEQMPEEPRFTPNSTQAGRVGPKIGGLAPKLVQV